MSIVEYSGWWDAQLPEFPAPICPKCNVAMWVNKRFDSLRMAHRSGFECRLCGQKHALKGRK